MKTFSIFTCGNSFVIFSTSRLRRRFSTVTSEEPFERNTPKVVAGRPLRRDSERISATPSCTSAMSDRRAKRPPGRTICVSAELRRGLRAAEHADRLLAAAHLRASAGRIEVQRAQLLVHFTAVMPSACMRAGSSSMRISRFTPPPR